VGNHSQTLKTELVRWNVPVSAVLFMLFGSLRFLCRVSSVAPVADTIIDIAITCSVRRFVMVIRRPFGIVFLYALFQRACGSVVG
jgi:hypothetical protein